MYGLVSSKQRGGLKIPSKTVVKLVSVCEKMFRIYVSGKDGKNLQNRQKISHFLYCQVSRFCANIEFQLGQHDLETATLEDDLHSTQLKKTICQRYIMVRLLTYGQRYYTETIAAKQSGKKQKLNRTAIFQNL